MNVWLVNHYAVPPGQPGGTRHYALARELVRRGHRVTIVASSVEYLTRQERHLGPREIYRLEQVEGVPFLWLRTLPYRGNSLARVGNMLTFTWRVLRWAPRVLTAPPDVIVGSSPHPFAAWAASRLAAHFRVPFVLEVRDLWPQSLIELGNFAPWHPFILGLAALERHLYRRAARIITLLPGAVDHIRAKGGDPARVVWIPNGLDLTLVPPPQPPPEDGVFTVMYAGAHGRANGLDVALAAARELQRVAAPPVRFVFVGDGPEKPALQAQARAWGLRNVRFEDPVPKREVYRRLQQADAFLMILRPSPVFRWGVSPNKLFDFMAMARPVLFCVQTPYNPVAEAGAGLSVPPGNAQALARALQQLAALSPRERWEMGLRGRRYVERAHAMPVLAARLEQTLQAVRRGKAYAT